MTDLREMTVTGIFLLLLLGKQTKKKSYVFCSNIRPKLAYLPPENH